MSGMIDKIPLSSIKHLTRKECSAVISSFLRRGADPAHIARLLHVGEGAVVEYGINEATIPTWMIKEIEILAIEFSSGRLKLQKKRQETPWKKDPGGRPRASIAEPEEVPAKEEIPAEPEAIRSHSKKPEWSIKLDSGFDLTPEAFFRGLKIFLQLTRRSYPDMNRLTAIAPTSWHKWHRSKCVPTFKTAVRITELLNEHYQTKKAAKAEAKATHTKTMGGVAAPTSDDITKTEENKMAEVTMEQLKDQNANLMARINIMRAEIEDKNKRIAEQSSKIAGLEQDMTGLKRLADMRGKKIASLMTELEDVPDTKKQQKLENQLKLATKIAHDLMDLAIGGGDAA